MSTKGSSGFIPRNTTNKFKDSQGRYLTLGLFKEKSESPNVTPLWTLEEAKQIFLEERDPTEYKPALRICESWEHWKVLKATPWFPSILEEWKEELDLLLRSEAIRTIYTNAQAGGREGATAAKWLAEKGWVDKQAQKIASSGRGRPSRYEVQQAARQRAEEDAMLEKHLNTVLNA